MADGNITVDVLNMDVAIRMRDALVMLVAAASNYVKPRRAVESRQLLLETIDTARAALAEKPIGGQVYGIIDPDYGRIYTMVRKLAWEEGYAIGLHGSFTRDLDLIAVPWTGSACEPEHLVRRIVDATGLHDQHGNPGSKPMGRLCWTLTFPAFNDPRFVDLSIMPIQVEPPSVREPLTDEQIRRIAMQAYEMNDWSVSDIKFARAVEAAHGIGVKGEA